MVVFGDHGLRASSPHPPAATRRALPLPTWNGGSCERHDWPFTQGDFDCTLVTCCLWRQKLQKRFFSFSARNLSILNTEIIIIHINSYSGRSFVSSNSDLSHLPLFTALQKLRRLCYCYQHYYYYYYIIILLLLFLYHHHHHHHPRHTGSDHFTSQLATAANPICLL
jgi:hypothetical protein